MYDWKKHVREGVLICPRTRERLSQIGEESLVAPKGGRFPVWRKQIPILLADPDRIQEFLSTSGMQTEYDRIGEKAARPAVKGPMGNAMASLNRALHQDFRTQESHSAFDELLSSLGDTGFCLSIGGGPTRDHPSFVNLNLAPFHNVDIVSDAHTLPYADCSVDGIYCNAVLEHLYDPTLAVREMYRVLKPGAKVLARTPFLQTYHGYPHHYQNFTLTGHEQLFRAAGFDIERSGVDVGPTFALVQMMTIYMQEYFPALFGIRIFQFGWSLFANGLFKRMDGRLNLRKNAYVMASTTFLMAVKCREEELNAC